MEYDLAPLLPPAPDSYFRQAYEQGIFERTYQTAPRPALHLLRGRSRGPGLRAAARAVSDC